MVARHAPSDDAHGSLAVESVLDPELVPARAVSLSQIDWHVLGHEGTSLTAVLHTRQHSLHCEPELEPDELELERVERQRSY